MSRIGRKIIALPAGVTVQTEGPSLAVKGPKGTLRIPLPQGIQLEKQDGHLLLKRERDEQAALHGLARSLLANAVQGVTQGFERHLDIVGIGYRAESKGKSVTFTLGYSHPIEFPGSRRGRHQRGEANASDRQRRGQTTGGARGREDSRLAASRSVQEQRYPVHRRAPEEEGRQGCGGCRRCR